MTSSVSSPGLYSSALQNCADMPSAHSSVGWGPNVVGQAHVGADLASPAGYALKTGQPVISNWPSRVSSTSSTPKSPWRLRISTFSARRTP
jgi:hypothetical protein